MNQLGLDLNIKPIEINTEENDEKITGSYNVKITDYDLTDTIIFAYYEEPIFFGLDRDFSTNNTEEKKRTVEDEYYAEYVLKTNLIHTKNTIYNYAKSNTWQYFCTFTYAPEEKQLEHGVRKDRLVDRYDYEKCRKVLSKWLLNMRQRVSKEIYYLFIAEYHSDKAIHFHGLIGGLTEEFNLIPHGKKRYHTDLWKYGRNDFSEIKDLGAVTTYITKYITKDIISLPGKSRYIASRGLKKTESKKYTTDAEFIEVLKLLDEMGYEIVHMKNGRNKTKYIYLKEKQSAA